MKLNRVFKVLFILYFILMCGVEGNVSVQGIILFLLTVAVQVWKEKNVHGNLLSLITLLFIVIGTYFDERFGILFAIPLFDFVLARFKIGVALIVFFFFFFLYQVPQIYLLTLMMIIVAILAHNLRVSEEKQARQTEMIDNERRLRYELEQAKAQLLHSAKEIATLAEIKERNRIARELHDSVGHSLAGILIQLQAVQKLYSKDEGRAQTMMQKSIEGLSETVELLRNTVHNIKPQQHMGLGYIQSIIEHFHFAPVDLKVSGDFNTIPANHLHIMGATIKEALTNTSRYSQATRVEITIDVYEQFTRMRIKDNGVGCKHIKEGLGLSGMRESVHNIGGNISISGEDGFQIVCILPRQEGSVIFAGVDR